jgi:hypothetical protein
MPAKGSSFIIKQYDGFSGNFIDSQYLGASYETGKPHMFENTLMRIYSAQSRFFTGKTLLGMTGAKSFGTKEIDTEVYRWKLQGAEYKCGRIVENLEAGNLAPGLNGTTFRFKLAPDMVYMYPDVVFPEDPEYPIQIVEGPIYDGTGNIYLGRLQGDRPERYLPPYLLEIGREFSKVWTSVPSEYNEWFGTQQYPNSFMLESQVGAFAQKLTITDKALREQGRLGIDFMVDGKVVKKFWPMAEAKMWDELYQSMEAQMWYGKKETVAGPGQNSYWQKTGPGIREQLKDGNTEYYNGPLTETRLKDYLMSIFFGKEDEQNRKVVAVTGTLGSILFHDMLAAEASSFLTLDTNFIDRVSNGTAGKHLAFGAQFTHYRGPEGIEVTLLKNPMYDSTRYQKRKHPIYTEMPIDSARFTFLDFGSSGGENNISMLKVKDTFRHGYTQGTVGQLKLAA